MANARGIRAGAAYIELFLNDSKLVRGLQNASKKLKAFGDAITGWGQKMTAIGAAVTAPLAEEWLDESQQVIRTITSTYDAAGRLTGISDADSSFAYEYDDLDRVTEADNNGTPDVPRVVLSMEYDANGNRSTLSSSVDASADLANEYCIGSAGIGE